MVLYSEAALVAGQESQSYNPARSLAGSLLYSP